MNKRKIIQALVNLLTQEVLLREVPLNLRILSYLSIPNRYKAILLKKKESKWLKFNVLHDNSRSNLLITSHLVLLAAINKHIKLDRKFHLLDVGGHYGQFTLAFNLFYPLAEFVVVEPNPINIKMLNSNLEKNRIKSTILELAIDDSNYEKKLFYNVNALGQSSFHSSKALDSSFKNNSKDLKDITVKTANYEHLIKIVNKKIHVIKIDVEGHERVVIRQVIRFNPQYLIIELTPSISGLSFDNLEAYLLELNYVSKIIWSNFGRTLNESYDVLVEKIVE